ncbi:MAG: SBBP repeat-containing protein, partial [Actinobacteria bacterium]|nr:SBBP repeat-containing protein [Actinomycetota bacterium]
MAIIVPIGALAVPGGQSLSRPQSFAGGSNPPVADLLGRIPLSFEANEGQFDPSVRFAARPAGHQVLLTGQGLLVSPTGAGGPVVGLALEGARPEAQVQGWRPLPAPTHRFVGDDPARWRTDVPTFGAVSYREAYPGIDVVFYGQGRQVEHDFVVAPGADPSVITLAVSGSSGSRIEGNGDLVLPAGTTEVRLLAPHLYQEIDGQRRPVTGAYRRTGDDRFGFQVGAYDRRRPLVIDPVLVSGSYLGGSSTDTAYGVALDADGNIVVAGYTESSDFPTLNPAQTGLVQADGTRTDVFVTKVKADGGSLLWSTYLGGRSRDAGFGVAVGPDGGVYVTGYSESADFPMANAVQNVSAGGASDVFVAKLNSAGSALEYSTYLGGKGADSGSGIAVDAAGGAYVVGSTGSADFPMSKPFQGTLGKPDDVDGFVAKVAPGGTSLAYSSYLGGTGDDHAIDVALDSTGNAFVVGDTRSPNFPTARPFQAAPGGGGASGGGNFADGFVVKVQADGSGLAYGTYMGGADSDKATAVAVDGQGAAYVSGNTGSSNFPVLNAVQSKKDGDFDAFVAKLRPDGAALTYSTYLGGSGSDGGEAIAVDGQGRAFVTGATASSDFPTVRAFQGAKGGGFVDAFASTVNANGRSMVSSSYLGGRDDDQSAAIAIDRDNNVIIVGYTNSSDFPIVKPFQPGQGGGVGDAFLAKVREEAPGEAASPAPVASKREQRVRMLVTVTGGLFIAAVIHTVWLRRRPEGDAQPAPAATGEGMALPGLRYLPRRGRQEERVPDGKRFKGKPWADMPPPPPPPSPPTPVPAERSLDDKRRAELDVPDDDERETLVEPATVWAPLRAGSRDPDREPPVWDERERPLLRSMERPDEPVPVAKMPVPDLWGSEAPVVEAAASVVGGDSEEWETVRADEALGKPDSWPVEERRVPPAEERLDPLDDWGPFTEPQEPEKWASEWGVGSFLKAPAPPAPPVPA